MSAKLFLSVAVGGALGATSRYWLMSQIGHWLGAGFPYATLAVNVIGSFMLGSLIELMALVWSPGEEMRALLVVGVLGSFTTFSTFSMDVLFLMERGQMVHALSYIGVSVALSITAFYVGMVLFRHVLA